MYFMIEGHQSGMWNTSMCGTTANALTVESDGGGGGSDSQFHGEDGNWFCGFRVAGVQGPLFTFAVEDAGGDGHHCVFGRTQTEDGEVFVVLIGQHLDDIGHSRR